MRITKLIASTIVAAGLASASYAGTLTEPEVEKEIEEVAASSSGGIVLPLLLLLAVGAAVASSDS